MKTNKVYILAVLFFAFAACKKDWNTPERLDITGVGFGLNPQTTKDEAYYEALRAYKKSDHAVAFGWYGNWTGVGASLENSLAGLPDSVDIVSLWGAWRNLTQAQIADLKFVQEKKGTKCLAVFIVQDLGSGGITPSPYNKTSDSIKLYWGWKDGNNDSIYKAIERYANAICDTIDYYKLDGFDIDFEPNYGHRGNLSGFDDRMIKFVETMGKRIGPKSGTGRLFVVDGEPQSMPKETGPYFDYFIVQAYNSYGDDDLNGRLGNTIRNFNGVLTPVEVANMYIVTENFEDHALSGGVNYTDRNGNKMKSLEGMARWNPIINGKKVRKGGVGTYHMEYEYTVSGQPGTYPFLRKAMHIMNPPVR